MISVVDSLLNRVTMYRLVVYGLVGLTGIGLILSAIGRLSFTPVELLSSLLLLLGSAFGANVLFGRIWDVPVNRETWLITALILLLILQPAYDIQSGLALILSGGLSSISKFILAPFGKHVFNPAALAAAFVSLLGLTTSTWWVGSSALWPFTLVLAIAVILKIRRYSLALSFFGTAVFLQAVFFLVRGNPIDSGLVSVITASPLLFLGGVMLTEPSTMPPKQSGQAIFGTIVGALLVWAPTIGPIIVYPEVALLIGNIYAFVVSSKRRYRLTLTRIEQISERVYNYVFTCSDKVAFQAGQYMEWTLGHVPADGRGNRRSFTIASSPTEDTIQVGLKYYDPSSTFKSVFANMKAGDTILAGQVTGSFTLNGMEDKKLVFIAGGIGVTPFRSMIKQIIDENKQQDIVVLYSVADLKERAYLNVFQEARSHGIRLITVAPNQIMASDIVCGPITPTLIYEQVPDFMDRIFFISGPNSMVQEVQRSLNQIGVHRTRIHTDYFSGY